jgi:uncharacterized damage-inducible protein DinB
MGNAGRIDQRRELLLELLDQAYERQAWHGPNLKGSLRGLTAAEAGRRPAPGRHSIHDIVLHAAYWKYTVRRRLTGERRGSFPVAGSNWFTLPGRLTGAAWREARDLLEEMHRRLRESIVNLPPERLDELSPGTKHTHARLIYGIASHDLYHAGQIQLLKRLLRQKK